MDNLRIVFMGTPTLAADILKGLINAGYNIVGLVAQKDKPVGRKGIIEPVPTKKVAMEYNIPVFQPEKIKLDYSFIKDINPDLIITCAYGQIVPKGLLDIPKLGCINVHGSLLPKYRGASPIQQCLINGDERTGVTIMEMVEKMDAGDMILQESFKIENDDNYSSLCIKMSECGLVALKKAIPLIYEKKEQRIPQDETLVTYCSKISKENEHLNLDDEPRNVVNWIKGLSLTPGGYVLLDDQILKIYKAEECSLKGDRIGEVISASKNGFIVAVRDGSIKILELQKQGKKKMDYKSFLNGEKELLGKILK